MQCALNEAHVLPGAEKDSTAAEVEVVTIFSLTFDSWHVRVLLLSDPGHLGQVLERSLSKTYSQSCEEYCCLTDFGKVQAAQNVAARTVR